MIPAEPILASEAEAAAPVYGAPGFTLDGAATGTPGLDTQLGGGFPRGTLVLVVSNGTHASRLFADRFAAAGLDAEECVYYYGLERPQGEVVGSLGRFLGRPLPPRRLHYLDGYATRLNALGAPLGQQLGFRGPAPDVTRELGGRLLAESGPYPVRVVIDSLTEVIEAQGFAAALAMLQTLGAVVKARGGVALALLEAGLEEPRAEARLRRAAEGLLEFGVERQGFGLYPYLLLRKMPGVDDTPRLMLYREARGQLHVETTRRV